MYYENNYYGLQMKHHNMTFIIMVSSNRLHKMCPFRKKTMDYNWVGRFKLKRNHKIINVINWPLEHNMTVITCTFLTLTMCIVESPLFSVTKDSVRFTETVESVHSFSSLHL